MEGLDHAENLARMRNGQLYYAFTPELIAARDRCRHACHRFNTAGDASRRRLVDLWKEYVSYVACSMPHVCVATAGDWFLTIFPILDPSDAWRPLHFQTAQPLSISFLRGNPLTNSSVVDNRHPLHPESPDEDGMDFEGEPYIDGPIKVDYGTNLK